MGFFDKIKDLFSLDSFYDTPDIKTSPVDVVSSVDSPATPVLGGDTQPLDPAATNPDPGATNPVPVVEPLSQYPPIKLGEKTLDILREEGAPQAVVEVVARQTLPDTNTAPLPAVSLPSLEGNAPTIPTLASVTPPNPLPLLPVGHQTTITIGGVTLPDLRGHGEAPPVRQQENSEEGGRMFHGHTVYPERAARGIGLALHGRSRQGLPQSQPRQ